MPEALNLSLLPPSPPPNQTVGDSPHAPLPLAAADPDPSNEHTFVIGTTTRRKPPPPLLTLVTPESSSHQAAPGQCPPSDSHAQTPVPCTSDQEFRHSFWHPKRQATYNALHRLHFHMVAVDDARAVTDSRLEAFGRCGSAAWIYASTIGPESYEIRASHCHDRMCDACATSRSWAVAKRLEDFAADRPTLFVTLTVKNREGQSLRHQLDHLYDSFRQLRRLKLWTDAVSGGAACCEIHRTEKDRWHCHLHMLVEARYLDAAQLARAWRGITLDSWKVDVQRVTAVSQRAKYVAKYASKPMSGSFWQRPELLEECITALRGRKLVLTFGTWYNAQADLDDEEGDDLLGEWTATHKQLCSLPELWRLAAIGDAHAQHVLKWLRVRDPLTGERPPPGPAPPPARDDGRNRCDNVLSHFATLPPSDSMA